jgi:hypothetical protein
VHVGYEWWLEREVLMALDADPGVEAVASQSMCGWMPGSSARTFCEQTCRRQGRVIRTRPAPDSSARHWPALA